MAAARSSQRAGASSAEKLRARAAGSDHRGGSRVDDDGARRILWSVLYEALALSWRKSMRWILLSAIIWTTPALAQGTPEGRRQAFADLHMEYSICIAYYNMQKACAPDNMKAEVARSVDPTVKILMDTVYKIGSTIGMTDEAMIARLKMSYDEAGERTKHSCINFSAEYVRHGQRCKLLAEHPDQIFYDYLKR
jgi:hypothetical protein